jgi:hypothetical protein
MKGGNRQRLRADPAGSARPPRPPRGLDPAERALWSELAEEVAQVGTYLPSDYTAFARMVRNLYRAQLCPLDAAPSAAGRLEQSAKSALESFGLTPASRLRIVVPKELSPEELKTEHALFGRPGLVREPAPLPEGVSPLRRDEERN